MGTCLTVIKVVGTSALGIYAGTSIANLTSFDIFSRVLNSYSVNNNIKSSKEIVQVIKAKLLVNGIFKNALGLISSIAFYLAYSSGPKALKHPYLIYSGLVFPICSLSLGLISGKAIHKLLFECSAGAKTEVKSGLDDSVYNDLGEADIEEEVELHLRKENLLNFISGLKIANRINSVVSLAGFVVSVIGIYGDY